MKRSILFCLVLFLITACTTDPCKDVNCINGNCVDGTCECFGGFIGPSCADLPCQNGASINGSCDCNEGYFGNLCGESFFGIYHAYMVTPVGCSADFLIENVISILDEEERLCNQNADGTQFCIWFRIWVDEDLTYTANLNQIAIDENGNASLLSGGIDEGTVSFADNSMSLTTGQSTTTVQISNEQFTWSIPADDCMLQFEFRKQ